MISNSELIMRLVLAALLGSAIGLERERLLWAAGLRTHMLVCVGACLIMIISAFSFFDILGTQNVVLDPSRIAAQVVSGIGFLGAGAILLRGEVVRGLTTAASVWAVAGIGLAVGGGLYLAAIATTILILIILVGIKPLEEKFKARKKRCILHIEARKGKLNLEILSHLFGERVQYIQQLIVEPSDANEVDVVNLTFIRLHVKTLVEMIEKIKKLPGILHVEEEYR